MCVSAVVSSRQYIIGCSTNNLFSVIFLLNQHHVNGVFKRQQIRTDGFASNLKFPRLNNESEAGRKIDRHGKEFVLSLQWCSYIKLYSYEH